MRALWKLVLVQSRLYLREPMGTFFTLLYAPLLLILMGFIFGNEPAPEYGGRRTLDVAVPTYAAIVVAINVVSVPIGTLGLRETGALRRFRATPLRPLTYIAGHVLVHLAMNALGIMLLFLLGTIVYRVRFAGNPAAFLAGVCLSAGALLALGYVLAGLAPSLQAATVLGNVLIIPMLLFSGTTVPLEVMPDAVRNVSRFVPLTHVVTLLRGLWFGEPFAGHLLEVAVLGGILVVGTVVAASIFRWE